MLSNILLSLHSIKIKIDQLEKMAFNRISILSNDVTMIDKNKQTLITTNLATRFALALLKLISCIAAIARSILTQTYKQSTTVKSQNKFF